MIDGRDERRGRPPSRRGHPGARPRPMAIATTQCLAHQMLGVVAAVTGYGASRRDHLTAAVALLDSGRVTADVLPHPGRRSSLLPCSSSTPSTRPSRPQTRRARRAEQRGALAVLPMAYVAAAGAHLYAGRWDDALAEIEAGLGGHRRHRQPQLRALLRRHPRQDRHPSRRPGDGAGTPDSRHPTLRRRRRHPSGRTGCSAPRPSFSPPAASPTPP